MMSPRPITIGTRTGTIVYLDAQWKPVEPEQATLARVLFEDGSTAFYTVSQSDLRTFEFNEADHPRDEQGKFSDGSSIAASIAAARPDIPYPFGTLASKMQAEPLPATLSQAENRIRNEQNEHVFILRNQVPVLVLGSNARDHVTIDKQIDLKDAVLTHNHPSNNGLSIQDGVTTASRNLSEIRAITQDGTYSMQRIGATWPQNFVTELESVNNEVMYDFALKIREHTMTVEDANHTHHLEVYTRLEKRIGGFSYRFEPRDKHD